MLHHTVGLQIARSRQKRVCSRQYEVSLPASSGTRFILQWSNVERWLCMFMGVVMATSLLTRLMKIFGCPRGPLPVHKKKQWVYKRNEWKNEWNWICNVRKEKGVLTSITNGLAPMNYPHGFRVNELHRTERLWLELEGSLFEADIGVDILSWPLRCWPCRGVVRRLRDLRDCRRGIRLCCWDRRCLWWYSSW